MAGEDRCVVATVNPAEGPYSVHAGGSIFHRMNTTTGNEVATLWTVDPMHSAVGFSVRHLMIANVRGMFDEVSGTVRYDARRPEAAVIEVSIPTGSIDTRQPQRDTHLRSAEFFDAANHPTITFRSTRVRADGGQPVEVIGNLTIRGTTREVTLFVGEVTDDRADHNGARRIGASATATIKRSEFGMTYNRALEAGGVAVADEIALTLDVSLVTSQGS